MKRKVKTKTKNGEVLYQEITYVPDDKPIYIEQKVLEDARDSIKLLSKKGKEYWCLKSDQLTGVTVNEGDTAILGIFNNGETFRVVEILKKEEQVVDLEMQKQAFNDLYGGY